MIKVVIVTPVHNRKWETLQCLRSLERLLRPGIVTEVIVVDDGSTDGTAEAVHESFPDVRLISGSGDLWYTAGTNRGIEAAMALQPDYVLAINNDTVFDPNALKFLVETAERYPRSVVGPLLLDWESPHKIFQVAPLWQTWKGGFRHWFHQTVWTVPDQPWTVDIIVGNCVLYPAECIRKFGLMDERRLPQYGDAEYTPRMRRGGYTLLIDPRARVFCKPNDPPSGFARRPLSRKLKLLFSDPTGPYSIKRRFTSTISGAPNTLSGLAAVASFYVRALIGRSYEGAWAQKLSEKPLSALYSDRVVGRDGDQ